MLVVLLTSRRLVAHICRSHVEVRLSDTVEPDRRRQVLHDLSDIVVSHGDECSSVSLAAVEVIRIITESRTDVALAHAVMPMEMIVRQEAETMTTRQTELLVADTIRTQRRPSEQEVARVCRTDGGQQGTTVGSRTEVQLAVDLLLDLSGTRGLDGLRLEEGCRSWLCEVTCGSLPEVVDGAVECARGGCGDSNVDAAGGERGRG